MDIDLDVTLRFQALLDSDAGPEDWLYRAIHPETAASHKLNSLFDLAEHNRAGFGAFIVVNEGGQSAATITKVRALFVDFDEVGDNHLERLKLFPFEPSLIIESSPGKHHAYWITTGVPLEAFQPAQRKLIALMDTDPNVNDLPRVMRAPGFIHNKGEPYQTSIYHESGLTYTWEQLQPVLAQLPERAPYKRTELGKDSANLHATILRIPLEMAQVGASQRMIQGAMKGFLAYARHIDPDRCQVAEDEIHSSIEGALKKFSPNVPPREVPRVLDGSVLADNATPTQYLIKGMVGEEWHGMLVGETGAYKSFVALGMAYSVVTGRSFMGRLVKVQGPVLYVPGEGAGGISKRWRALERKYGKVAPGQFMIYSGGVTLSELTEMQQLKDTIEELKPVLVIFDTFNSLAGSVNENDAGEVGAVLKRIRWACGAAKASLTVHHLGKNATNGARGSSAFKANADFQFLLKRNNKLEVTLECDKVKDGDDFEDIEVDLEVVPLSIFDDEGEEATSLVIKEAERLQVSEEATQANRAFECLRALWEAEKAFGKPGHGIVKDKWYASMAEKGIKSYREQAKRLVGKGRVECVNEIWFRPVTATSRDVHASL